MVEPKTDKTKKDKPKKEFKDWYEENKEDLSKKRHEKYHSDPEYRRKILERGERYREKRRAKLDAQSPQPKFDNSKMFTDDHGNEWKLYTISSVAAGIGRSIQCVNRWEAVGYLPPTPFRYARVRYFTTEMIEALAEIVGAYKRVPDPDKFKSDVYAAWNALDLPSSVSLTPIK